LAVNVIFLRFRYAGVSIATDLAILAIGGVSYLLIVRRLAKDSTLWAWAGSRVWQICGVVLIGATALALISVRKQVDQTPPAGTAGSVLEDGRGFSADTEGEPRPWNVIILSIDTLRPDHLGSYGYERPVSPNLDSLAADGVRFANAYSTSPWTLPSHHSLVTGQYPSTHGSNISPVFTKDVDRLAADRITLAEVLQAAGYSTAAFTSASLVGKAYGFDQGFDTMEDRAWGLGMAGRWEAARDWLATVEESPFFLFLHCFDVHDYEDPSGQSQQFVRPYDGPLRNMFENHARRFRRFVISSGFFSLERPDVDFLIDLYDAGIFRVDSVFGEILSYLEEEDLRSNTLLLVLSDHGEEFWEHGGTGHGFTLHEELLRIPALMRYPGSAESLVVESRVRIVDFMPTILDLLRLPAPADIQGESLVGDLEDQAETVERPVLAEASHVGNSAAIIVGQEKLIREKYLSSDLLNRQRVIYNLRQVFARKSDRVFDLRTDPREFTPLTPADRGLEEALEGLQAVNRQKGKATADESVPMDQETLEQLRALGYLD